MSLAIFCASPRETSKRKSLYESIMKLCSACLQELDKEAFSAKQWKLNQHQRRCKNCVDGGRESQIERPDVAESGEYLPKFPLTDEAVKKAIKDLIDNAVKMIMKRGIPPNVGLDGFNEKKLAKRLWKVSCLYVSLARDQKYETL